MTQHKIMLKTKKRNELIDITSKVKDAIKNSKAKDGLCIIFTPHATAAIMLFENADPALCEDFIQHWQKTVPQGKWRHDKIDGNGDAHIKSGTIGCSETIPIKENELELGTWQGITFCEFDGPRTRTILVKVIQ